MRIFNRKYGKLSKKDKKMGVKYLTLGDLSNGYIMGGQRVIITGQGNGSDNDRVICAGYKKDLKNTELWASLYNCKIWMLHNSWGKYRGLVIQLDVNAKDFKKLEENK